MAADGGTSSNALLALSAVSGGSSILSSVFGSKANKDALKAQKRALKLNVKHAEQNARREDRQLVKSIAMADAQAVERIAVQERQAQEMAAEDRLAIKADLDTANLNAAKTAADIRKGLNSTLGEQQATLAARGLLSGSLRGSFDAEAREEAATDLTTNEINRLTAGADAEAQLRSVDATLKNMAEANALNLKQQRQSAKANLTMTRVAQKDELRQMKEAADAGYGAARSQTAFANTALLLQGFGQVAATAYDFVRTQQAIEPTARESKPYNAPRPLARASSSRVAGSSSVRAIY